MNDIMFEAAFQTRWDGKSDGSVGGLVAPGRFEPFFAIHGRGAAGAGGGDRLAVVGIDDVSACEDSLDVGGGAVIGQAVEQSRWGFDPFPGQGGAGEQVAFRRGGELAFEDRRVRDVADREEQAVELQVAQ